MAAQTCGSTLIQNAVDPTLRARVVSLNSVILVSAPASGARAIGDAAERLPAFRREASFWSAHQR